MAMVLFLFPLLLKCGKDSFWFPCTPDNGNDVLLVSPFFKETKVPFGFPCLPRVAKVPLGFSYPPRMVKVPFGFPLCVNWESVPFFYFGKGFLLVSLYIQNGNGFLVVIPSLAIVSFLVSLFSKNGNVFLTKSSPKPFLRSTTSGSGRRDRNRG